MLAVKSFSRQWSATWWEQKMNGGLCVKNSKTGKRKMVERTKNSTDQLLRYFEQWRSCSGQACSLESRKILYRRVTRSFRRNFLTSVISARKSSPIVNWETARFTFGRNYVPTTAMNYQKQCKIQKKGNAVHRRVCMRTAQVMDDSWNRMHNNPKAVPMQLRNIYLRRVAPFARNDCMEKGLCSRCRSKSQFAKIAQNKKAELVRITDAQDFTLKPPLVP